MLVATRYGDVGKQSTHFISSYTSMRNPYSTTFTAKDGNTRVPSTYLQVTASTEKGRGSFWKDLSPGSRRSEDPKWFCSRFLFPPFLIKKKKKKYPNCYVPPGKKIPVCVKEEESRVCLFPFTSCACPFYRWFCWFLQGSGRQCSCMFCLLFLMLHLGSSGRMSWQHRWQRSQSHVWSG